MTTATDLDQRIALLRSPFAVLGATTRDNKARIVELADEASLSLDHDVCQQARAELTNARTRLSAEMGWLPGVSPRKAAELVDAIRANPLSAWTQDGLPALAHCNLLTAAFDAVDAQLEPAKVEALVWDMAYRAEDLDPEEILREINEDRSVSGFPEVRGVDQVEEQLAERKRHYRKVVQDALGQLYTNDLISVMTNVVELATTDGTEHAPEFVDELVDAYAVESRDFLQKEAANIDKLVASAREKADAPETVLGQIVGHIDTVVRNWCKVAKPLTMSFTSRGLDHDPSTGVAYSVRSLAIDLFNDHDRLDQARRLTLLLKEMFEYLPEFVERVEADEGVLKAVTERREGEGALKPLMDLCTSVREAIERDPGSGITEGHRVFDSGMTLLRESALTQTSANYREGLDFIALSVMTCAVAYGNRTSKWGPCVELLDRASEIANDGRLKQKVKENLDIARENHVVYGDLDPIQSAPSLRTINGVGFSLYGNTDRIPSNGSYLATYYFVFLFVPVFPIARYRVIPSAGGYQFLGKGKLRGFDKAHIAISLVLILIFLSNV
ncbi:hypothetical protein [Cupriavidus necator]|uniref:hypothetical protein n=1 Tax=Cupriavidus necator TaxID=106590 RepID=UPI00068BEBEA|nr:hypothetical protein [Cupriavidus necator]